MSALSVIAIIGTNLIWQSIVICGAVFMALKVLPRSETYSRYYIALSGLVGTFMFLFVPFFPKFTQTSALGILPATTSIENPATVAYQAKVEAIVSPAGPADTLEPALSWSLPNIMTMVMIVWIAGVAAALFRLFLAARAARSLVRDSDAITLAPALSLSRNVPILTSKRLSAPLVTGLLNPVILIPPHFTREFQPAQIKGILEHEIAHIDRRDLWTNLFQRLVLASLWWCLPLYWLHNQIGIEREKICDEIAARRTGTGNDLARALVRLAEHRSHSPSQIFAIGIDHKFTGHAHALADRVHQLFKETNMTKRKMPLLLGSSMLVPLTITLLSITAPRAIAHNTPFDPSHNSERSADFRRGQLGDAQLALYEAAFNRKAGKVTEFIQAGINPDIILDGEGSPLIEAVRNRDTNMVNILIGGGATVDLVVPGDGTALITAAHLGDLNMATNLINFGADVNTASRGDGNPLIATAFTNDVPMATLLVSAGADVNAKVQGDETPLVNAAQAGNLDVARYLISQGADVSLGMFADGPYGREWRSPLGEAQRNGHVKMEIYLAAQGAKHTPPAARPAHTKIVTGKITSKYGTVRKRFNSKLHKGLDIKAPSGTPIYAPKDGIVLQGTDNFRGRKTYGNVLVLQTDGNIQTVFAHLDSWEVPQGSKVTAGQLIARVGNTGNSTGPHVHIETLVDGNHVDPLNIWPGLADPQN